MPFFSTKITMITTVILTFLQQFNKQEIKYETYVLDTILHAFCSISTT